MFVSFLARVSNITVNLDSPVYYIDYSHNDLYIITVITVKPLFCVFEGFNMIYNERCLVYLITDVRTVINTVPGTRTTIGHAVRFIRLLAHACISFKYLYSIAIVYTPQHKRSED